MSVAVAGQVAPGFEPVREVFERNFSHGVEVGASFCVYRDGEPLVDLWGGHCDLAATRLWQPDTLVNVYSTTKGLAAAAVAAAVESGALDYEAPVTDYWPELTAAATGLTVSQLLSHQAGLCGVREPLRVADLFDWDAMCRRLERERPFWAPGTAAGYHAVTWGFLAGELVRRATGGTLASLFTERIAAPLGADVHIGLPESAWGRAADLIGPNRARRPEPAGDGTARPALNGVALANPLIRPYADACSAAWRRAELAASNGHGNARGIARIYAALAGAGALAGTRILAPQTVAALRTEVWGPESDLVLGYGMRRGRGVNLNTRGELGPSPRAFGHTGTGGSVGFADPETALGVAYVMNQLWGGTDPGSRAGLLIGAVYACLAATGEGR
jgi:CubicO group peptidase (beta-lactamase class C family)